MTTDIILTEDEFEEKFQPKTNHLDDDAEFSGWMYEEDGEQFKHVKKVLKKSPYTVWTVMSGDEGTCIVSGFHIVDCLGYIITEVPFDGNVTVELDD